MDERKYIPFQQFSFQIRGHKAQMGNEHWSVTVKQSKITRVFIFPISKITTSYFFLCSQNSKTYLLPEQITTFRKQKQSVTAFSSTTKTTYLVHSVFFAVTTNSMFLLSSQSNGFICALALLSSPFLKKLIPFSVQQHQFFPQWMWHWHTNLLQYLQPLNPHSSTLTDYSILLSLSYLIFFPQFIPVRILFPLNCY